MSTDLKFVKGDFSFGPDGNPILVEGIEKLKQDIAKILKTVKGRDPGSAQYGSGLPGRLRQTLDISLLQALIGKDVSEAVNFLQSLQFVQSTKQTLDFQEVIGSVDALGVRSPSRNKIEVSLAITTVGGLREIFSVQLGAQK